MAVLRIESLRSVRADWLRAQSEVAFVRMLFTSRRYRDAIEQEQRFNPYHDILGRFTTAEGAGGEGSERPQPASRRVTSGRTTLGGRTYNVTPQQQRDLTSAAENATQAVARVRAVDPEWRSSAGPSISDPNSVDGAIRMYRDLAQEANGRALVLERGGVPLGFNSRREFQDFGRDARNNLMFAGQADAELYLRGSSVTGYRYRTGQAFDAGRISDYDLAIVSPRLMEQARMMGYQLRSSGNRTMELSPTQLRDLNLTNSVQTLSAQTGRKVTIMIYETEALVQSRGPNLRVP